MKRKALWVLIGVFFLGMGSGVFVDRAFLGARGWWSWGWRGGVERKQARLLKFLSRKLDLSEGQRAKIAPILRETWGELFRLRSGFAQNVDQLLEKSGNRIRPILKPDQAEKFEEITRKFRRRWKKHRRRRGHRPS